MIWAIALGLVIGLALGALGGGGSILAVPVLVHLAGQAPSAATATSLVAVGVAAAVASIGHRRSGNVHWPAALAFVATGVPGSWAGTTVNQHIDGDVLLLLFSVLVLVAAHRMLTACPSCTKVGEEQALTARSPDVETLAGPAHRDARATAALAPPRPSRLVIPDARGAAKLLAAGTAVGFLTGLFGVGGGFVIVPALTLALGLSMPVAIGTSLVVIAGNAAVALGFRGVDAVQWDIAVPFTLTMLVGSTIGSLVATRLPARRSLHAFAALLVAVAVANGVAAALALVD